METFVYKLNAKLCENFPGCYQPSTIDEGRNVNKRNHSPLGKFADFPPNCYSFAQKTANSRPKFPHFLHFLG